MEALLDPEWGADKLTRQEDEGQDVDDEIDSAANQRAGGSSDQPHYSFPDADFVGPHARGGDLVNSEKEDECEFEAWSLRADDRRRQAEIVGHRMDELALEHWRRTLLRMCFEKLRRYAHSLRQERLLREGHETRSTRIQEFVQVLQDRYSAAARAKQKKEEAQREAAREERRKKQQEKRQRAAKEAAERRRHVRAQKAARSRSRSRSRTGADSRRPPNLSTDGASAASRDRVVVSPPSKEAPPSFVDSEESELEPLDASENEQERTDLESTPVARQLNRAPVVREANHEKATGAMRRAGTSSDRLLGGEDGLSQRVATRSRPEYGPRATAVREAQRRDANRRVDHGAPSRRRNTRESEPANGNIWRDEAKEESHSTNTGAAALNGAPAARQHSRLLSSNRKHHRSHSGVYCPSGDGPSVTAGGDEDACSGATRVIGAGRKSTGAPDMRDSETRRRDKQRIRECVRLARGFRRRTLLRRFGFNPWVRLVQEAVLDDQKADTWYRDSLMMRMFEAWRAYRDAMRIARAKLEKRQLHMAALYYERELVHKSFRGWVQQVSATTARFQQVRRKSLVSSVRRAFRLWTRAYQDERLREYRRMLSVAGRGDLCTLRFYLGLWRRAVKHARHRQRVEARTQMALARYRVGFASASVDGDGDLSTLTSVASRESSSTGSAKFMGARGNAHEYHV